LPVPPYALLSGVRVRRPRHLNRLPGLVSMHAAFAGDQQGLRRQYADEYPAVRAETLDVEPRKRRVIADIVRRRAVNLLPQHLAGVHVVRGDPIVRRLDQRDRPLQERACPRRAEAPRPGAEARRTRAEPGRTGAETRRRTAGAARGR